ncbi:hypothetical protein SAMN05880566_102212 [Janthinobacterium sp. TND4EL3]|jgi:hypothetical protein|uniref:hypothetical protein n=1 Tax=Janthinobacterium sp. TND4EL3 TaxID=1907311 RepID=UPI000953E546|nr:hypothetical protein [Janthinobacterium sp. TND4EL3]SIQ21501.1 hypothetical protein SAMN05880566_102212 [Janthinobacterium sp. TND4EL3]
MTARLMHRIGSRPYLVLRALLEAPGTFYQICERIGADLEQPDVECRMRETFGNLLLAQIKLDNITYSLTTAARLALQGKPAPSACSVATAHHRGPSEAQPVTVVRRAVHAGQTTETIHPESCA